MNPRSDTRRATEIANTAVTTVSGEQGRRSADPRGLTPQFPQFELRCLTGQPRVASINPASARIFGSRSPESAGVAVDREILQLIQTRPAEKDAS